MFEINLFPLQGSWISSWISSLIFELDFRLRLFRDEIGL